MPEVKNCLTCKHAQLSDDPNRNHSVEYECHALGDVILPCCFIMAYSIWERRPGILMLSFDDGDHEFDWCPAHEGKE